MMKMITGKVSRTGRLICCALLLSLCSSFLLSTPTSAASLYSMASSVYFDGRSTAFNAGQASYDLPAAFSRVNTSAYFFGGNMTTDWAGWNNVVVSTTVLFRSVYSSSSIPRPVEMSCPVLDSRFVTQSCDVDTVESTYGDAHYTVYNFVIKGVVNSTSNPNQIGLNFNLKNFSENLAVMWFTPVEISIGPDEFSRLVTFSQRLNSIETYLSAIDTRSGVTQGLMYQIKDSIDNLLTAIQNSSTAGVVNELQEMNDRDEQDREDFEQAQQDAQDAADDSAQDFSDSSQSLLSAMGTVVGLVRDTPATNCQIPVNDIGPNGVLDLGNVDVCSIPNDVKQVLNRVFGLVMIVASAFLAWNVFNMGLNLLSQAMGYGYNVPKGVD